MLDLSVFEQTLWIISRVYSPWLRHWASLDQCVSAPVLRASAPSVPEPVFRCTSAPVLAAQACRVCPESLISVSFTFTLVLLESRPVLTSPLPSAITTWLSVYFLSVFCPSPVLAIASVLVRSSPGGHWCAWLPSEDEKEVCWRVSVTRFSKLCTFLCIYFNF